jgi:hypothetical protein
MPLTHTGSYDTLKASEIWPQVFGARCPGGDVSLFRSRKEAYFVAVQRIRSGRRLCRRLHTSKARATFIVSCYPLARAVSFRNSQTLT